MQQPVETTDPCAYRACLAPHAVDARICTTHMAELRSALRQVIRVEDDLDITTSRQARLVEDTGGSRGASRPLPFAWNGAQAAEDLVGTVTTWARHVARVTGAVLALDAVVVPPPPRHTGSHLSLVATGSRTRVVTPPPRPNRAHPVRGSRLLPHPIVTPAEDDEGTPREHDDPAVLPYRPGPAARAAQWLLDHLDLVRWDDELGQLADEIVHVAGRTQHVIDRAPTRWYLGTCDHCWMPLYARPEATFVPCRNPECVDDEGRPNVYAVTERRAWLLDAAQDYMVTAAEASRAVPMLADPGTPFVYSTFRDHLGHAIPADRTHPDGHARYRLGDCIQWAQDRAAAAAATPARQVAG